MIRKSHTQTRRHSHIFIIFALLFLGILLLISKGSLADSRFFSISLSEVPGQSTHRIHARALLNAPIKHVWDELIKYRNYGIGNSLLDLTHVESHKDKGTYVGLKIGLPKPFPKVSCVLHFEEQEKNFQITLKQKEGCFRNTSGRITMKNLDSRTEGTLVLDFNPSKYIPQWALQWGAERIIPTELQRIERGTRRKVASVKSINTP